MEENLPSRTNEMPDGVRRETNIPRSRLYLTATRDSTGNESSQRISKLPYRSTPAFLRWSRLFNVCYAIGLGTPTSVFPHSQPFQFQTLKNAARNQRNPRSMLASTEFPSGDLKSDSLSLLRLGRTTKELSSIRQIGSNRGISTFLSAYKDYSSKASMKEHVKYNKTHVESLTQALRFSKMDAGRLVRRQGDAST